jgi:DNA-binding NarL/FixJ family response regulator
VDQSKTQLKAVVLDADRRWCTFIVAVLATQEVATVATALTATAAVQLIEVFRPDLFVADVALALTDIGGVSSLILANRIRSDLRSIVLSEHDDPDEMVEAFRAGASAYVLKSAQPDELASAVRQVFKRSIFFPGAGVALTEAAGRRARADSLLTRRELEILGFAAAGVPNAEIARSLWVSEQTVKYHLSNLYKKIGVTNRTEASRWAYEHGIFNGSGHSDSRAAKREQT